MAVPEASMLDRCEDVRHAFKQANKSGVSSERLRSILAAHDAADAYNGLKSGIGVDADTAEKLRLAAEDAASERIKIEAANSNQRPDIEPELSLAVGKDVDAASSAAGEPQEGGNAPATGNGAERGATDAATALAGKPEPNMAKVREFLLSTVCAPGLVHHHSEALVEIASSNPDAGHKISIAKLFTVVDIDGMTAYAAEQSVMGRSLYLGLALRKPGTNTVKRSKKEDALGGYFAWADADTPDEVERLQLTLQKLGIKPLAIVTTGTIPTKRIQVVIKTNRFMEPAEIEEINKLLMAATGSDLVADAGRVMRLPGTVNIPKPDKMARGYIAEPATVQIAKGGDAAAYDPDDLKRRLSDALSGLGDKRERSQSSSAWKKSRLGLTDDYPETDDEILAELGEANKSGNWHNAMLRAIAKFASRGYSETAIRKLVGAFCEGGESDPDLAPLIQGAFNKGFNEGREGAESVSGSTGDWIGKREARKEKLLSEIVFYDEYANFPPIEWQIDGVLPERAKTVLFGVSNSFKSFLAIDMACCIATGTGWHGRAVKRGKVLYIATEGAYGVGRKRIPAWMAHHGIPHDMRKNSIAMVPGNVIFKGDMSAVIEAVLEAFGEPPALIVVDVLAGTMDGSESDDEAARDWVEAATQLVIKLGSALLVVSHSPYSDNTRMRGHSHIWGSFDTRLMAEGNKEARTTVMKVDRHKDHDSAGQWGFKMTEAAPDEHAMETSLVPILDESGEATKNAAKASGKARLTANQQSFMAALRRAIEDGGEMVGVPHVPADRMVVNYTLARQTYLTMTPGNDETKKSNWKRCLASLIKAGAIVHWANYLWIANG